MAKPSKSFDMDALLDGAAITTAKKKKSTVPEFVITDTQVAEKLKLWIESNKSITLYTSKCDSAKDDLKPEIARMHLAECLNDSKVHTTVKCILPDGSAVMIDVAKNQYSKIPTDAKDTLIEIFGEADYHKYFETITEIALTSDALADKEILCKLVKAVGEENFKTYFKVTRHIKPTEAFHNARFLNKAVTEKLPKTAEIVKPYNFSYKSTD